MDDINNPPKVSVVIPLYNKAPYIARALDSVFAQTVQDFEIIVVNDGSTDGSETIVGGYNDPRIRLVNQKNQGVSVARNRGVDEAQAELVAFLDADDEWLPQFLETILTLREKYPEAGLYGTAYKVIFPGNKVIPRIYSTNSTYLQLSSYFSALASFGSVVFNSSSFASVKKYFQEVGGYTPGVRWNEDGLLWSKIAFRYPVAYCNIVCSIYHQYSINNSTFSQNYLSDPVSEFFETIDHDILSKRSDYNAILYLCDLGKLAASHRNIYSGHDSYRIREDLKLITQPTLKRKKHKVYLLSYVPKYCIIIINKNSRFLSRIKWMLKQTLGL